jgi:hypothetical protein
MSMRNTRKKQRGCHHACQIQPARRGSRRDGPARRIRPAAGRDSDNDPFDDDSLWEIPKPANNRGALNLLGTPPEGRVHHHENQITVAASSLDDGWVTLRQCHQDIDRVGRAQILYNAATTTDIEIESQSNIAETWVEGASVQLRQVQPEAELCVRARSQMLRSWRTAAMCSKTAPSCAATWTATSRCA